MTSQETLRNAKESRSRVRTWRLPGVIVGLRGAGSPGAARQLRSSAPTRFMTHLHSSLLGLLLLAGPATAQLAPEPGFATAGSLAAPSVFGAGAFLDEGRLFDFDGQNFTLYDQAGGFLQTL